MSNILFIGLDVHKESIEVAIAEDGLAGEVRHYGKIGGCLSDIDKLLRKLVSKNKTLHFCYEAGPCGYELHRHLTDKGHICIVVAPSLIPKKSGDKVKTDKRDSLMLARLFRAREDAMIIQKCARQRLKSFLLRHNIRYAGSSNWSEKHLRWLAKDIVLTNPVQKIVLQEYINTVTESAARLKRLVDEIDHNVKLWQMYPVVEALMAMRGVRMVVAVTIVSELGDITRFKPPSQLMSYLGLTPSEYSSGQRQKRGCITKTGNHHAVVF